jgi:hypothetical protein
MGECKHETWEFDYGGSQYCVECGKDDKDIQVDFLKSENDRLKGELEETTESLIRMNGRVEELEGVLREAKPAVEQRAYELDGVHEEGFKAWRRVEDKIEKALKVE